MIGACVRALAPFLFALGCAAHANFAEKVVDVPTRPGITQRVMLIAPADPRAVVMLYAGGHGGLRIALDGSFGWGRGNFLVRSRQRFAQNGLAVAVVDAPSDRQEAPYFEGFRQSSESAADARALIAWLRARTKRPVWVVGTSAGTESAAFIAHALAPGDGADGVVLTASILRDRRGRSILDMPLERISLPALVIHHEEDGCAACPYELVPNVLMSRLAAASRRALFGMRGGENRGNPCEAFAYHGFNGLEEEVVGRMAAWILAK